MTCDLCGRRISTLADAWVQWRRDERGFVDAVALIHRDEAKQADDLDGKPAARLLARRGALYLRKLPRSIGGAQVFRVLARVHRLAAASRKSTSGAPVEVEGRSR